MGNDKFIRRWTDERNRLTAFLFNRGFCIGGLVEELGDAGLSKVISELSEMGEMLEQAEIVARESKDIRVVGYMLGARAKVQKDSVYTALTFAIGELPTQIDGYVAVLRDYIKDRFDNGVKRCERIFERVK